MPARKWSERTLLSFAVSIAAILAAPQAIEARVAVARDNTWDSRVAEIYRILEYQLDGAQI